MSYATNRQMFARIGEERLAKLQGETILDEDLLTDSRRAACGEMNGYLRAQEQTPVDTFDDPTLEGKLRDVELALVEYLEHSRDDVAELPGRVKDRRKEAIEWLESVRLWKVPLRSRGGERIGSVEVVRGDTQAEPSTRRLEFNLSTGANPYGLEAATDMEHEDSGFDYWVADAAGSVADLNYRASGDARIDDTGDGADLEVTVNGTPVVDADLNTTIFTDGICKGQTEADAAVAFVAGDRVGVRITPPASDLDYGYDVKVMLGILYS